MTKAAFRELQLKTTGMEFASEMIIKATLRKLRIAEVPITLHKDGRSHAPHLKPWRDGWRHLRFMLIYSPTWLFLIPGLIFTFLGASIAAVLALTPLRIGGITFSVGTMAVACMAAIVGVQVASMAFFTKTFAIAEGLLPDDPKFSKLFRFFNLEKGLLAGIALLSLGATGFVHSLWVWGQVSYGVLPYFENMRRILLAGTLMVIGIQVMFSSFFMSVLGLTTASRKPPATPRPLTETSGSGN